MSFVDYRESIKSSLMHMLYFKQYIYWNDRLQELARENAMAYGRHDAEYSINYLGKNWAPEPFGWPDAIVSAYALPLHESLPELEERMAEIVTEFGELISEKYEAERFLSGLVLFPAHPDKFRDIIGDTLYSACAPDTTQYMTQDSRKWDNNAEAALQTYYKAHPHILQAMNERLMTNLITMESA